MGSVWEACELRGADERCSSSRDTRTFLQALLNPDGQGEGGEGRHGREEPTPERSSSHGVTRRPYKKRKGTGRGVPCIWGRLLRGNIQPDSPYEVVLCEINYS